LSVAACFHWFDFPGEEAWTDERYFPPVGQQTLDQVEYASLLGSGRAEMGALLVGNVSPYRPITTERDRFRRTIVAPKESFELLFPRVQTSWYVPDNVGTSMERSGLLPLL
jgi:hypothetical protein